MEGGNLIYIFLNKNVDFSFCFVKIAVESNKNQFLVHQRVIMVFFGGGEVTEIPVFLNTDDGSLFFSGENN